MTNTQSLVLHILKHASAFKWSVQGLGMLRLYLSAEVRLHIWDKELVVSGVSSLHNHPWDFESEVVFGEVHQFRYLEFEPMSGEAGRATSTWQPFMKQRILCGEGGGVEGNPKQVMLHKCHEETFKAGATYMQAHDEIHTSFPLDSTVTIIRRTFHADVDHANVFYPTDVSWVTAEPHAATPDTVRDVVARCMYSKSINDIERAGSYTGPM